MLYILDGYNIIKQVEEICSKELKLQRDWLINLLINKKPQGSYKNKVVVVFDGKGEYLIDSLRNRDQFKKYNIEVLFAEIADDKIKQLVEGSNKPREIVVVSNDKGLCRVVSYYGAKVLSVKKFLDKTAMNQKLNNKNNFKDGNKNVSQDKIKEIDKELKKYYNIE